MALRVKIPFAAGHRAYPTGALVADDDPIVKGNEAFFEAAEEVVSRGVEQATAAPGEKRAAKPRSAAKKAAPKD